MALALARRPGESITLDTDNGEITIEVSEINGLQVRLAVTADKSVEIVRTELLEPTGNELKGKNNSYAINTRRTHRTDWLPKT